MKGEKSKMKNKLIVTALILVATMCVSLMSGCWVDSARIEFVEYPAATYYVGEDVGDFVIRDMDTKKEYHYVGNENLITIENFSTATPGSRTAKVTFGDYTIEFAYTVIGNEVGFAGGDGSMANPYQVANVDQFNLMLAKVNTAKTYYKLVADIDFAGEAVELKSNWYIDNGANYFNGVVDGNNYKVTNLCDIEDYVQGAIVKFHEVFGVVGPDFALKNIEFNFAAEGEKAITGLTTTIAPSATNATITFDHVKVTGYIDLTARNNTSVGVFMAQADRSRNSAEPGTAYSITDCTNEVNIYNGSACQFVSAYLTTQAMSNITFTNNTYKGTIEGGYGYSAAFIGMYNGGKVLSSASKISGNSILDGTKIVSINPNSASVVSGAFGCIGVKDADLPDATVANSALAFNTNYPVALTELYIGSTTVGKNATHTFNGIHEDVKTIRVIYSTSYAGKGVMNGGVLIFAEEFTVAEGATSMTFLAPTVIAQYGQPEGAKEMVTGGMFVFEENGVKTVYTNRLDPADATKGLTAIAVGLDANGKIVWTSGKRVAINAFTVA